MRWLRRAGAVVGIAGAGMSIAGFALTAPAAADGPCGQDYSSASACAINAPSPSAPYDGAIVARDDTDYYVFHASAETHLSVSLTDTENPQCSEDGSGYQCGGMTFGLYDAQGDEVNEGDPDNEGDDSSPNGGVTVPVNWSTIISTAGTYYLEVSGYQGEDTNGNPTNTPYSMAVSASPTVVWPPPGSTPAPNPSPTTPSFTPCAGWQYHPGPAITYVRTLSISCPAVQSAINTASLTGDPHWVRYGTHWGLQGGQPRRYGIRISGYSCQVLKLLHGGSGRLRETNGMNVSCSSPTGRFGFVWDSWVPQFSHPLQPGEGQIWGRLAAKPKGTPRSACGGRYRQISIHPAGAVLILKARAIACPTITTLAKALLHGDGHLTPRHPASIDGYLCRYVPINAGGGGARCTRGRSMVLFGFE